MQNVSPAIKAAKVRPTRTPPSAAAATVDGRLGQLVLADAGGMGAAADGWLQGRRHERGVDMLDGGR